MTCVSEKNIMESDLERALDVGHGRYNVLVLFTCGIIQIASILDMLGFSVVAPAASCDLKLGLQEISWLTSISFASYLFALPWGHFADLHGRRKAILISSSVGFFFGIMTSFATSFQSMMILKFLGCCFSTASLTLTSTYVGECTGMKRRNKYLFILNGFNLSSDFICFALAFAILRLDFNIPLPLLPITFRPWRLFSITLVLPLGIGAVLMFFLKESPKFLANKGESAQVMEVLKTCYGISGTEEEQLLKSLVIEDRENKASEHENTFWQSIVKQIVPIFRPPLLKSTLQLFYLMAICCGINNIFFMWFPTMVNSFYSQTNTGEISFCEKIVGNISSTNDIENITCNESGVSSLTVYWGMAFSILFTSINLIVSTVADKRKLVLITTLMISGISAALADLIYQPIVSMIFFILVQLTGICIGNVGSYFVDAYPTSCRSTGSSLGMMFVRVISLSGVSIIGATIVDHCRSTFIIVAIIVFSGVGVAFLLPADKKRNK